MAKVVHRTSADAVRYAWAEASARKMSALNASSAKAYAPTRRGSVVRRNQRKVTIVPATIATSVIAAATMNTIIGTGTGQIIQPCSTLSPDYVPTGDGSG